MLCCGRTQVLLDRHSCFLMSNTPLSDCVTFWVRFRERERERERDRFLFGFLGEEDLEDSEEDEDEDEDEDLLLF